MEVIMHNLISFNQLAGWNQSVEELNRSLDVVNDQTDLVNDYYNCLIECQDNQQICKRICKEILSA
jgi:hypothetical protein